ncbi:patatin-like phospholipase family protein [Mesorhizobium australicum]|uniref:Patatin-like phospholipase family protein n=1 Tax=Mesorhizobium australicum TaxID=536018 RepID=A0ACC6T589_9HYPH
MNISDNLVLVLSGGNALGPYHAGAYEALVEKGHQPKHVVGTSIGAITGAIIAGNRPEDRLNRLHAFWAKAEQTTVGSQAGVWVNPSWQRLEKSFAALQTIVSGRPGLFGPELFAAWPISGPVRRKVSILETCATRETLCELVDFDLLNEADPRLTILAVDVEKGSDVVFDTMHEAIGPDCLRASAAMPVLFNPIEIGGRWLVDGGLSANLPVRLALGEPRNSDAFCIALDLLSAKGDRPDSTGAAAGRAQDIVFSCQSRHAIQSLTREYDLRQSISPQAELATTVLLYLAYNGGRHETALKMLDFTTGSIRERWAAGKADMLQALDQTAGLPAPVSRSLSTLALEHGKLNWIAF